MKASLKQLIAASADWTRIVSTTIADGRLTSRDVGPYAGPKSFDGIAGCD